MTSIEADAIPAAAPLWLADLDVSELMTVRAAIDAVGSAFVPAAAVPIPLPKNAVGIPGGGVLQSLGAVIPGLGLAGAKSWVTTPNGAAPLVVLWRITDGGLAAVMEAASLGRIRTGALAGVATRALAGRDAHVLGLIGAGRQAMTQLEAVCAVRPIEQVRVYSRDEARRAAFADRARSALGVEATAVGSVADAVSGAQVVTLVTNAVIPVLEDGLVAPGTHVNGVGAIRLGAREFDPALLDRCSAVAVDDLATARQFAQELIDHAARRGGWDWVTPLAALSASPSADPRRITLYKGVGSGIADVAVAAACLARAIEAGAGRPLA